MAASSIPEEASAPPVPACPPEGDAPPDCDEPPVPALPPEGPATESSPLHPMTPTERLNANEHHRCERMEGASSVYTIERSTRPRAGGRWTSHEHAVEGALRSPLGGGCSLAPLRGQPC